jgi:hypothetical protein
MGTAAKCCLETEEAILGLVLAGLPAEREAEEAEAPLSGRATTDAMMRDQRTKKRVGRERGDWRGRRGVHYTA